MHALSHAFAPTPRWRAVAAALAAVLAAGCVDRTVAPEAGPVQLSLTFGATAIPNGTLAVDVFYRRDNATTGAQVSLFSRQLRSDALGGGVPASFDSRCAASALAGQLANCTVSVPIELNLGACLADERRRPEGGGCPVVVTLLLRDATGRQLGTATAGPVQVFPGRPVVFPEVTLPLRG